MKRVESVLFLFLFVLFIQCVTVRADNSGAVVAFETSDHAYDFNELMAFAERGDIHAQVKVGWMYYYGEGVRQDKAMALVWYRKAAEQGDLTSMFNLAYEYEHGDEVNRNLNESRRWYGKAAEQKNTLERLDFERLTKTFLIPNVFLARVAQDRAEQKRILSAKRVEETKKAATVASNEETTRIAAAKGEEEQKGDKALSKRKKTYGHDSVEPLEVPPSTAPAVPAQTPSPRMVKKDQDGSSLSPSTNAEIQLSRDPHLEKIRRAAEAGDINAQVNLGWIYSSGKGIPADKTKAVKWYRLAAENGSLNAQMALGWIYFDGQGSERNLKESAVWYGKAAAQGDIKARQMLKKINRLLRGI